MKIRNSFIIILTTIIIASCGHDVKEKQGSEEAPIPVKVLVLKQETVYEPVHASGNFTTDDETVRSFKTGGIVQRILVREGDAIKKGQLLATLDLTEITAQVTQATLAFDKAKRDYNRVSNLYRDSVVTLEQFQNAGTGLDIAREQLTAAQFNKTFSEIRASDDGFILKKFVNEGQVVGPGTPVFQTNGAGKGDWILRVAVSDGQWSLLERGDLAVISTDLPGLGSINAMVSKKSEGVDPVSGTFTIEITPLITVAQKIASGMFGKVTIKPAKGSSCWTIPYDALLDGDGTTGYVFVTCDGKKAQRKKVSIAGITRDHVMIDKGLEGCDKLIISGSAYLTDQSPIQIIH
ncbi:MAG: efflux RND transporter periplasmic adaptor subunit [Bacteroidota bacterium]